MKEKLRNLLKLYLCFVKIGVTTFGGGYAMLPILQRELEEKRGWCTTDELMDYFAVGQCTPGTIAMNVSTFVGYKIAKIPGAIATNLGFITAPLIIVLIIASFLQNFADYEVVKHAFAGIRVCVCVLIVQAVIRLWKKSIVDAKTLILAAVIFLLTVASDFLPFSIPTAVYVLAAGIFGVLFAKDASDKEDRK